MESDETRDLGRTLERAEAAPYIHYPRLPWFWPPAAGLWFAAMLTIFTRYDGNLWVTGALLVLLAIEVAYFRWYSRKHGAFPVPFRGNPPAEIRLVFNEYFAGWAAILVLVGLTWWQLGDLAAIGATFVLVTALFMVHERRYAAAAAAVEERLA